MSEGGWIGVAIAAITAISGFFALRTKANTSDMERLDKLQAEAFENVKANNDTLEKRLDNMLRREVDLLTRLDLVEKQIAECHRRSSELLAENMILKSRLPNGHHP